MFPYAITHVTRIFFTSIVKTSHIQKVTLYTELCATQFSEKNKKMKKKYVQQTLSFIGRCDIQGREINPFKITIQSITTYTSRIWADKSSRHMQLKCDISFNAIGLPGRLFDKLLTENPVETHDS